MKLSECHELIERDNLIVHRNNYGERAEWVVWKVNPMTGTRSSPGYAGRTLPDAMSTYAEDQEAEAGR